MKIPARLPNKVSLAEEKCGLTVIARFITCAADEALRLWMI